MGAKLEKIVSFADMFTDAGFQKYLIQHDFFDDIDRDQSTTVAFWSNFTLSIILWGAIAIYAEDLAIIFLNRY